MSRRTFDFTRQNDLDVIKDLLVGDGDINPTYIEYLEEENDVSAVNEFEERLEGSESERRDNLHESFIVENDKEDDAGTHDYFVRRYKSTKWYMKAP